jgi:hypothetical protein
MSTLHLCRVPHRLALLALLSAGMAAAAAPPPDAHANPAPANPTNLIRFDQDRQTLVSLDRPWRFHTGDDPDGALHWTDPSFDDSAWSLLRSDKGWDDQGYKGYTGSAWYRLKLEVPANTPPLSLYVLDVNTNYQVYADGNLIATYGEMPPHAHTAFQIPHIIELPAPAPAPSQTQTQAHTLTIAMRVWMPGDVPVNGGGGLQPGMLVGTRDLIQEHADSENHRRIWRYDATLFLAQLEVLGGIAAIALFAIRRKEWEYLWFGLFLLGYAALQFLIVYSSFHAVTLRQVQLVGLAALLLVGAAIFAFYYRMLRARPGWLFWLTVIGLSLNMVVGLAFALHLMSSNVVGVLQLVLSLPMQVWLLRLLFVRVRQGDPDARLLLAPVLLYEVINNSALIVVPANLVGLSWVSYAWLYAHLPWYYPVAFPQIADLIFLISMFAILIHRFWRAAQQQERFSSELEAARIVQQILIPEHLPKVPGFAIEAAYKPAGQVGGDFFQILPLPGGAVLIVVGDVSGKGLPAAMTVSLLVGTLQAIVDNTPNPGTILEALNARMINRSNGGFTTCLVLRADPDGALTLANAGHLAPYLDGAEMVLHNGLPLGILADAVYAETSARLEPGQQLTLMTDGVVEARSKPVRNKPGELFGFTRTAAVSQQTAETIAETAQKFGQDDDITVLTLIPTLSPA